MASNKKYGLLYTGSLDSVTRPKVGFEYASGEEVGIASLPAAYVSWEDYNLIWRLLQRGAVTVELNIENSYSEKPVDVYNTVVEIKGSERPDEVVIIGGHLDSWDLGTGATDNGTGVAAVLGRAGVVEGRNQAETDHSVRAVQRGRRRPDRLARVRESA
jgi:Iap family predicted aminopeptidase